MNPTTRGTGPKFFNSKNEVEKAPKSWKNKQALYHLSIFWVRSFFLKVLVALRLHHIWRRRRRRRERERLGEGNFSLFVKAQKSDFWKPHIEHESISTEIHQNVSDKWNLVNKKICPILLLVRWRACNPTRKSREEEEDIPDIKTTRSIHMLFSSYEKEIELKKKYRETRSNQTLFQQRPK